jgi:hypothetical protein
MLSEPAPWYRKARCRHSCLTEVTSVLIELEIGGGYHHAASGFC